MQMMTPMMLVDRSEEREEPKGLRAVEAGEEGRCQDGDDLGKGGASDEFEDVGSEGGGSRGLWAGH